MRSALSAAAPAGFTAEMVIKGDSKVYSIAAASVIAKVTRDRIMRLLDRKYPEYDLAQHKGYPTPSHKAAVLRLGPSPSHRFCFAPIKGRFLWVPSEERGADDRCWVKAAAPAAAAKATGKVSTPSSGEATSNAADSGARAEHSRAATGGGGSSSRVSRAAARAQKKPT